MSNFYRMFAAYYNTIFPFANSKGDFFNNILARYSPKAALDLGCATGELTGYLNRNGCRAIGVDLSQDLLELAQDQPGEFVLADMVDYLQRETAEPKDLLICIGNTLPHLEPDKLKEFLKQIPAWLNQDGLLIIQTVNYDKILAQRPPGLPTIERPEEGVTFTRLYTYNSDGSIAFTGILDSPEGKDQATVTLWPFTSQELKAQLPTGLRVEAEYGSFAGIPYDSRESPAWVLVARQS
ncbi:MAG: class I SAM-dependent methyltransferase [Bacillota bacterium]|jgi:glycine/sarcosine N-methyltransferase